MQTLVDMAEKHSTEESHRMLLAVESVAEGFSLAGWLESEGFDVLTATDGQEALQIACSSWQPDVVLLDLTLPGVDGFSVYKQVRAKNRAAVILVMGNGSGEDEIRSLEAGADDYLAKRFSPEVLLARVRAHLRSRRAAGNQRILQYGDLIRRAGATWRGASSRTVDINISRIRTCVETPSDYTYIHSIRGVGYRFEPVPKEISSQASPKNQGA
jgi:DNA-binding response OmpR family regulator